MKYPLELTLLKAGGGTLSNFLFTYFFTKFLSLLMKFSLNIVYSSWGSGAFSESFYNFIYYYYCYCCIWNFYWPSYNFGYN